MSTSPQRHHPVEGTVNFRDVGGYATRDGRHTRWHTLYRSDSLHALTPDAQQHLLTLGVRTVVDLRRSHDVADNPHILAGSEAVEHLHIPVFEADLARDATVTSAFEFMRRILVDHAPGVVQAMAALAAPGRLPAVVHCLGGTHRTGIVIALCLRLAGVPDATVLEDFALTDVYSAERHAQARERRLAEGWTPERIAWFNSSPAPALAELLALLDDRYGGAEGYLRAGGMGEAEITALRERLVE